MVMQEQQGFIDGVGGVRLHYLTLEVPDPQAALLVVHGLGDHSGRYVDFARAMTRFDFSTFSFDQRGHGRSEGRRGHAPRFETLLQDLDRFRREVQGLVNADCPVFIVGHSFGGLVALRYLEEYESPARGAVIVSPWLATAMPVPRWKVNMAAVVGRIAPAMPFSAHIDARHLTHDDALVQAYREDPLVHDTITPRLFSEVSSAMGLVLQRSDRIKVPLLFLLAGDDRIVDVQRSAAFAKSLSAPDVTTYIYPNSYHELLNEVDRNTIHLQIRDWIETRLAL
jgi:alpha-beta hydrolase superfamily lysophospholipase